VPQDPDDIGQSRPLGQSGGYQTGGYLRNLPNRVPPPPRRIARRRFAIGLAKFVLPAVATILLGLVALYPEILRMVDTTRLSLAHVSGEVEGGKLLDARYNGVDERGRPYTVTAATAWQIAPDRVALTMPKGDITMENGTWLMLTAKDGTYAQSLQQLDLLNDVTLYRDDGTTMHTHSATIDIKAGAAAGSEDVHVEGPFGTLDAKGFTLTEKGSAIDFPGPAHVILNGSDKNGTGK
jgi:lipopolysaccharide export system protein LptC